MTSTTPQRFKTDTGLAGYQIGTGQSLVLLHGVGLCAEAWEPLTTLLKDNFTIYAVDMAGHGDSEAMGINAPTLQDYSDLVIDYIESFKRPICLAGHSMGAMIALDIAARRPELIQSFAALNAIYRRTDVAKAAVQARAANIKKLPQGGLNTDVTLARWFGDTPKVDNMKAVQSCKAWLSETPIAQYYKAYNVFAYHDGPSAKQLLQLAMPALFITGADEPNSTPVMSHKMAELTPFGQARIIEDAAHMMPMTHTREVARAFKSHFNVKDEIRS